MSNNDYYQKLKDPRWQKKRLEVLSSSDFMCEMCQDTETELHVYHKDYFKSKEPWEYAIAQCAALCKECHSAIHKRADPLRLIASFAPYDGPGCRVQSAFLLAGYIGMPFGIALNYIGNYDNHIHKIIHSSGEEMFSKNFVSTDET